MSADTGTRSVLSWQRLAAGVGRPIGQVAQRVWLLLVFVLLWQVGAGLLNSLYLPDPVTVFAHFWQVWSPGTSAGRKQLAAELWPSLERILFGWAGSAVVGVVIGLAVGRNRWVASLLNPLIRFGMNLPAPVLLPLTIVIFGFGPVGKFMLILFGVVWPILLNSILGASEIDPVVTRTARTLGVRRTTFLAKILLPAAAPAIFTGLRIGLSLAIILTVIAEMYTATNGVGHAIVAAQRVFDIEGMWAGIVVLALVGVGLNLGFSALERRVLAWQYGLRRQAGNS